MGYADSLLKFLLYVCIMMVFYFCARVKIRSDGSMEKKELTVSKFAVVCLSTILGWYATICGQEPMSSDRYNYAVRFLNDYDDPWTFGLNTVADFLHLFTNDPNLLFFTITFLFFIVTLAAFHVFEEKERLSLLLLISSPYCLYSFYLLKQAPAIAFAALSIAAFLQKKRMLCLASLVIAITFHESAYILLPLFLVLLGAEKRWVRFLEYTVLILCVVFFQSISQFLVSILGGIPSFMDQIDDYLSPSGAILQSSSVVTAIKGFPYYVITLYALFKRRWFKDRIKHYDRYLVLCVFASTMIVLSAFNYWMWRLGAYCYFPMFIFASLLMRECKGKQEKMLFYLAVVGSMLFITGRFLYQMFFLYGGF